MLLHETKEFKDIIDATAQAMNMRSIFIEKDYWVTFVLKQLADSPHINQIVFKGGTSLSKAYKCIYRFSEDIDLAVLSPDSYADGKMKALLKKVSADITRNLIPIEGHEKETKFGKNRTTAYSYPQVLVKQEFGIVKDYILVEINCFTNPLPYNLLPVQSYVAEFLTQKGEQNMVLENGLEPFMLNVLSAERTYFEKALSISRLSYNGINVLKEKLRHFYDIYQLQQLPALANIHSASSYEIIHAARKDDLTNRTMSGEWRSHPISQSPLFQHLPDTWKSISAVYGKEMGQLAWAQIPTSLQIFEALKLLKTFLETFDKKFPP